MREIKFRAWDMINKYYFEVSKIDFIRKQAEEIRGRDINGRPLHRIHLFKDIVIEQYVGLKDRNGNEIFEGDIVCGSYGIPPVGITAIVVFENGLYIIKTPEHNPEQVTVYEAIECLEIEIRGNKYENPDLLKEKK